LAAMRDDPDLVYDEPETSKETKPHGITRGAGYYGGKRS
jgi:hypothetical protein